MEWKMRIDCDSCEVRGLACGDCVVAVLLGAPPSELDLDDADRAALQVLADSGLVPPLRHASIEIRPRVPAQALPKPALRRGA